MTEYLTDDWGFFVRVVAAVREVPLAVPDGRGPRHRAVRQAVPARRPFHDVGEGRVLLSREPRPLAALTHPSPERALIVGGGDGGSAEELLKHPSIQSVTLCEIDLAVVDIARKYLQTVHRGALDDPRLTLHDRRRLRVRARDRASSTTSSCSTSPIRAARRNRSTRRISTAPARAPEAGRRDDAAHREPGRASGAHPRMPREPARGLSDRHAVPHVGSALRRPVDDGLRVADARPEEPVDARGRPPHRAARPRRTCSTTTATCTARRSRCPISSATSSRRRRLPARRVGPLPTPRRPATSYANAGDGP